MAKRRELDKEELRDLYHSQKLSTYEIAKLKGCTSTHVRNELKRYGIGIKTLSERSKLSSEKIRKFREDPEELRRLYWNCGLSMSDIARRYNVSMLAVADYFNKHNIPKRTRSEQGKLTVLKCPPLRGERNPQWKGGKRKCRDGYIDVMICSDSPFFSMAKDSHGGTKKTHGYVPEHRLVMAEYLGRPLTPNEVVHHANGVRSDNRIENLQLKTYQTHPLSYSDGYRAGYRQGYKDGARHKNKELQKEIRLLRWQIRELQKQGRLF